MTNLSSILTKIRSITISHSQEKNKYIFEGVEKITAGEIDKLRTASKEDLFEFFKELNIIKDFTECPLCQYKYTKIIMAR